MKFKYTGPNGFRCFDLAIYGVKSPKHILNKGDVFEVPETEKNQSLIRRLKVTGVYEVISDPVNLVKSKKIKSSENKNKGEEQ